MVPVIFFHIILTSMLYKQLSACMLLLCDVGFTRFETGPKSNNGYTAIMEPKTG